MAEYVPEYRPSAKIEDAPECAHCDKRCCLDFTMCLGNPCPEQIFYLQTYLPQFRPLGDIRHGQFTCEWATPEGCAHYDQRPEVCRRYPSDSQITVGEALYCPLVERLWFEKYHSPEDEL